MLLHGLCTHWCMSNTSFNLRNIPQVDIIKQANQLQWLILFVWPASLQWRYLSKGKWFSVKTCLLCFSFYHWIEKQSFLDFRETFVFCPVRVEHWTRSGPRPHFKIPKKARVCVLCVHGFSSSQERFTDLFIYFLFIGSTLPSSTRRRVRVCLNSCHIENPVSSPPFSCLVLQWFVRKMTSFIPYI